MKKASIIFATALLLASCGGYSEDQEKAADEFCACMEAETYGDFDIDFYECDVMINSNYPGETFSDDGWSLALEETCPTIAGKIAEGEED
jgi:hypothetical protein